MKRHPRAAILAKARAALDMKIAEVTDEYDITGIELAKILTAGVAEELQCMLRRERHPKNPSKGADVE